MERMGKFVAWVGKNADGVIALVLAVFIAFLGLTASDRILGQPKNELISGVTLLVLGLVTAAILRDRWRQEPMEETIRENFRATSGALADLPARLDRLARLEVVVEGAPVATSSPTSTSRPTVRPRTGRCWRGRRGTVWPATTRPCGRSRRPLTYGRGGCSSSGRRSWPGSCWRGATSTRWWATTRRVWTSPVAC
ncbi:MAG: hypothetical protein JWQ95_1763 [Sphaerisporangium sp.]|nr:hypothetical protein [Sphaerisporangium sp.]